MNTTRKQFIGAISAALIPVHAAAKPDKIMQLAALLSANVPTQGAREAAEYVLTTMLNTFAATLDAPEWLKNDPTWARMAVRKAARPRGEA